MKTQTQFWHDFLEETKNQRKNRRGHRPRHDKGKWLERICHESTKVFFRNNPHKLVFRFENLDLSGLDFCYTELEDVLFENCNFQGAQFNDSYVESSWFEQCNFTDADFLGQHLLIRISKSVGLIMSLLCVRGLSAVPSNTARLKQHDFTDVSFHN